MSSLAFCFGIVVLGILSTTPGWANHHQKGHAHSKHQEHREHAAHSHGSGTLAIAFDETKGTIEFKSAAESILGFEHEASSDNDKKTVAETSLRFESEIGKMIEMEPSLGCVFQKEKIGQIFESTSKKKSQHSNWSAVFNITCKQSPIGSKIKFDFSFFKALHQLEITVLAADIQKSTEYKGKPVVLELK